MRRSAFQRLISLFCLITFGISHAIYGGLIFDCDHGGGVRHFEFACAEDDDCCSPRACDHAETHPDEIDSQSQGCTDTVLVLDDGGAQSGSTQLVAPRVVQLFVALPASIDEAPSLARFRAEIERPPRPPSDFSRLRSVILVV